MAVATPKKSRSRSKTPKIDFPENTFIGKLFAVYGCNRTRQQMLTIKYASILRADCFLIKHLYDAETAIKFRDSIKEMFGI